MVSDEYHLQFSGKPISEARFFRGLWKERRVVHKHSFTYNFTLKNISNRPFPGGKIEKIEIRYGGWNDGLSVEGKIEKGGNIPYLAYNQLHPFNFFGIPVVQSGPALICLRVSSEDSKKVIIHQPLGGIDENDPQIVSWFNVEEEEKIKNEIYVWIALIFSLVALISNLIVGIIQILIAKGFF